MTLIEPVDPALVEEAESGECRVCGRDFMFVESALEHVTRRPCQPPLLDAQDLSAAAGYFGRRLLG